MRQISILVFAGLVILIIVALLMDWIAVTMAVPLFVGLMSLVGVLLTLESNHRQAIAKLTEEREKESARRRFEAKQAAFSRLAESLSKALNYLTTLTDRKLPTDGTTDEDIKDMAPALVHLHFYCDYETIEKTLHFGEAFARAIGAVIRAKVEIMILDGQITTNEKEISERQQRISRLDEENILLLRVDVNHPLLAHIGRAATEIRERLAVLHTEQVALIQKKNSAIEKCRLVALGKLPALQRLTNELLLCARRELNFPIAEDKYATLLEQQVVASNQFIQEFTADLTNDMASRS